MLSRRAFFMAGTGLGVWAAFASPALAADPVTTVKRAAKLAVQSVGNRKRSWSHRRDAAIEFADLYFSTNVMARNAMGQSYKKLTGSQQSRYKALFADYLVEYFLDWFSYYDGQKVTTNAKFRNAGVVTTVNSSVRHNGRNIKVDWILIGSSSYRLIDVKVGGLSMRSDVRRQFEKVYRAKGYKGLINSMNGYIRRARQERR